MSTTWRSAAKPGVSAEALMVVNVLVTSVGIVANSGVLTVLIRARRHFGSSVHTLISNQCAMDLFASVFALVSIVTMLTHGYRYNGNPFLDGTICVLVEGLTMTVTTLTASKLGLIVITIERYIKIVHAIAHRKYWRHWMTSVAAALPWIGGMCLVLFPAMASTRIVNGRCLRFAVWQNEAMTFVSMHIISFTDIFSLVGWLVGRLIDWFIHLNCRRRCQMATVNASNKIDMA